MTNQSTGFWQRLLAPFRSGVSNAVRPDDPARYFHYLPHAQAAGVTVTMDTALELSVVWACVTAITNAIASCRWHVASIDDKGRRQVLEDDPLTNVLSVRPNADMTALAFREVLLFGALTWGNGYAEIQRTGTGKVVALWPLLPSRVYPRREVVKDANGNLTYPMYYQVQQQDGGTVRVEAKDMFHLRGPGITGLMGDNVVARAAQNMSIAAAQERFAATYFGNNTVVGGVIEYPKTMSKQAHENLKNSWQDEHKGPTKAHKVAVLEDGAKWVPFGSNAADSQLVESRKFQIEEICRWYGVPPHKVQHLDRATFNNIEHLSISFMRDALTPWALRLEQEADFKLISQRGPTKRTKLDMGWLTHGDFKSRMEGYQMARRMGVYTINDILHKEGENTIGPDGDVRIVESNMQTLEHLMAMPLGAPVPGGGGGGGAGDSIEGGGDGTDQNDNSGSTGEGGDGEGKGPANVAREAIVLLFASVFERYDNRLANRETDLRRGGASPAKISAHMAEERIKLRPWVLEQAADAMTLAGVDSVELLRMTDAIDNGMDPRAAAEQLATKGAA